MDTHETTVRLPDLRQRFDSAREGKPLSALGHARAQLVVSDSVRVTEKNPNPDPPLGGTADRAQSDPLASATVTDQPLPSDDGVVVDLDDS